MSWNAGSLSAERNLELSTWLNSSEGSNINLVAVQETHWRGPLEYTTERFYGIHSGTSVAQAGLLLLVDKTLYTAAQIQHREILPGRLMHVRLEGDPGVDVVICYQHAWSLHRGQPQRDEQRDQLLGKRAELLAQLATLLQSLPKRNQLLLLGDLNSDLQSEGSHIGKGVHIRSGKHAGDSSMLQDLVRALIPGDRVARERARFFRLGKQGIAKSTLPLPGARKPTRCLAAPSRMFCLLCRPQVCDTSRFQAVSRAPPGLVIGINRQYCSDIRSNIPVKNTLKWLPASAWPCNPWLRQALTCRPMHCSSEHGRVPRLIYQPPFNLPGPTTEGSQSENYGVSEASSGRAGSAPAARYVT